MAISSAWTAPFESRVVLDESQTQRVVSMPFYKFESRVVLDESQTLPALSPATLKFESRVILDGSQTDLQKQD